jgi:hypothetical protein
MYPHALFAAERQALKKKAFPCPKGGLKSAATMPKSPPGRNAVEDKNRRFRQLFSWANRSFSPEF